MCSRTAWAIAAPSCVAVPRPTSSRSNSEREGRGKSLPTPLARSLFSPPPLAPLPLALPRPSAKPSASAVCASSN
eukprot:scaffold15200_cov111-Isochrysis_galbana.AAC.5